MKKTIRQKLAEKLLAEHNIELDPQDMESFRRNGYGSNVISWATVSLTKKIKYQSFFTMKECLALPTKLIRLPSSSSHEITIDIDFEKIKKHLH